eukprot:10782029-Lingulodinium_polyedra.AAC.1
MHSDGAQGPAVDCHHRPWQGHQCLGSPSGLPLNPTRAFGTGRKARKQNALVSPPFFDCSCRLAPFLAAWRRLSPLGA